VLALVLPVERGLAVPDVAARVSPEVSSPPGLMEPVLVLVCVEKEARFHDALLESGTWAVSVLPASDRRAAEWFATRGRPLGGQLDRFPHRRGEPSGAALLDGALAWLQCETTAVYDGGDHDIVVGSVLEIETSTLEAPPLVYYRGAYRQLG